LKVERGRDEKTDSHRCVHGLKNKTETMAGAPISPTPSPQRNSLTNLYLSRAVPLVKGGSTGDQNNMAEISIIIAFVFGVISGAALVATWHDYKAMSKPDEMDWLPKDE
jgi:hypothetical protein